MLPDMQGLQWCSDALDSGKKGGFAVEVLGVLFTFLCQTPYVRSFELVLSCLVSSLSRKLYQLSEFPRSRRVPFQISITSTVFMGSYKNVNKF